MARSPYDHVNAIPTTYKGVEFRSRLEARWAAFFDLVGWEWEYEAVDLHGYIPDFVLPDFAMQVIAEIKPAMRLDDFEPAKRKIERSGWSGDALIFGSRQNLVGGPSRMMSPGIYGCPTDPENRRRWKWSPAIVGCQKCKGGYGLIVQFADLTFCVRCGSNCGSQCAPGLSASDLWAAAGNAVQYAWRTL